MADQEHMSPSAWVASAWLIATSLALVVALAGCGDGGPGSKLSWLAALTVALVGTVRNPYRCEPAV